MTTPAEFEIFLATAPGLESVLCAEAREKGFKSAKATPGGVTVSGGWTDVWRANLEIRGASRILARIESFKAVHLSQLDKRAHRVPWKETLRSDVPFRVEAACKASRIYHSGAATERIEKAIRDSIGAQPSPDAEVTVKVRIEKDVCTLAVDTSGELLHKRGHKEAVNKAPMRENLAALFLRQCSYQGTEPVLDPMCGSGTFVIEAAEIAAGLPPGRSRHFAFEKLATFDETAWQRLKNNIATGTTETSLRFFGSDRDPGAIRMSRDNAERAGVTAITEFTECDITCLATPGCPPGLVIANPPYGARIGETTKLKRLYRAFGETLRTRFAGWRVGLITNDAELARATALPFTRPAAPVAHGGIRVKLYQTDPL